MWFRQYKDYPIDTPVIQEEVEPGNGIVGCEMHEINGWGDRFIHIPKKRAPGFIRKIFYGIVGKKHK